MLYCRVTKEVSTRGYQLIFRTGKHTPTCDYPVIYVATRSPRSVKKDADIKTNNVLFLMYVGPQKVKVISIFLQYKSSLFLLDVLLS